MIHSLLRMGCAAASSWPMMLGPPRMLPRKASVPITTVRASAAPRISGMNGTATVPPRAGAGRI